MTDFNYNLEIQVKFLDFKKIDNEYSKSIFQNIFFKNKYTLISNSKQYEFLHKYNTNPRLASLDYYNNQHYYNIILTTNSTDSTFNFNYNFFQNKKLLIPSIVIIRKILSYV